MGKTDLTVLHPAEGRKTIEEHLRAAAMLLMQAMADLDGARVRVVPDELKRRELNLLIAGLAVLVSELRNRLVAMRVPIGAGACAHCGWPFPPLFSGHCPRCQKWREVRRPEELKKLKKTVRALLRRR